MWTVTNPPFARRSPEEIKSIANNMAMIELANALSALDPRARVAIFRLLEKSKALDRDGPFCPRYRTGDGCGPHAQV
ncbi:hypothetical protein [Candidatus Viridilinea mediisalina]|uniref:hypothetical protein n=1 Tax=Candidatus Viridilinea mediisalina TaxID=2024553 RepID=UPI000F5A9475|nr:hypothetical protein [Candidatus Viridilinea mediisalina]